MNFREVVWSRMKDIEGVFQYPEAHLLYEYARLSSGPVCEVGTLCGRSLTVLGYATEGTQVPVFAVDPFLGQQWVDKKGSMDEGERWFKTASANTEKFKNVKILRGISEDFVSQFEDGFFSFIFIDALHDYVNVKNDSIIWQPKLRAGGYMAFHDFGIKMCPGVSQRVEELVDSGKYEFAEKKCTLAVLQKVME